MSTETNNTQHLDAREAEGISRHFFNAPTSGIGRRRLLQTIGAGALGMTAFGGSPASAQDRILRDWTDTKPAGCPSLLKFSRTVKEGVITIHQCHCQCAHDQTIQQNYSFSGRLTINDACDETKEIIPNNALMTGYGTLTVRPVECGTLIVLVGYAEADFGIYGQLSPQPQLIFSGKLQGTFGLDPHAEGEKRCCAINRSEGTLKGDKLHKPGTPHCSIYASYQGRYAPLLEKGTDPCKERTAGRTAQLDGVISCPCIKKG